ncbi:PREDICTED: uncharacterized protein LOC108762150 [Trachymyrmex cornetzi]|uniref:uncharacterized protein LOC108762150 n=1 Tax=Trachymyrmex cornetzi TaxID=471704 RepID=UPI00084EF609|nr:PREDICTED: uncharacterized protein LOC108762150 [Trachymyrmex cornetzi]
MASVSSVSVPGQGQHSFRLYWALCNSTLDRLNRLGEYCKLASDKIKAVVYKQVQDQDEEKKIEDKVSELAETIKIHAVKEPDKYSSINDMLKTDLFNDTMPEKEENIWNKDIDTANLFPNADNLADQKNEEDMLSIVESIVTAKLESEFCINKERKDQSNTSENNTKDIVQDAICTNLSESQKINEDTKELKLIKHSDGNNNDSKLVTLCMSKVNDEQNSTCKKADVESSKASTEANNEDGHVKNNITKTSVKTGSNTNLIKDNEKPSTHDPSSSDFKKAISNSSKLLSTTDKNARDHFNNKHKAKNTLCIKKQEFVKQRNVSRNGTEKEIKKPNSVKTDFETTDIVCQSKNLNKDKTLSKQTRQFPSKLRGQESFKKNASTSNFSDDKNKNEKSTHVSGNLNSPLNESERKNEKIVNEQNFQSDQKANRNDFRKNTTFVTQYKNSTFSKSMQNVPRTGQAPMYGRNSSYAYNNPKFNRNRNDSAEHKVMKKELTPINVFTKSNTGTEKLDTNNLESCTTQKEEIIQPPNVKSTNVHEVDTLLSNDKNDTKSIKVETHLIQSKENMNIRNKDQGSTISEQYCEKINISKVDVGQQYRETNKEDIKPLKHSSNLASDKCATDSQTNAIHQYSSKLENMQRANDVNQLENSQITWNPSPDNDMQKGAAIMSLQQSIQNMHFNTQQTFTQTGNLRGQSSWEPNNSKFYDQHFSVNDAMRLSQIPNTFNAPPYSKTQISNDDRVTGTSTLETTNRENSNVLYRYGPNIQQRPVMASDFPGHSVSSCQTNQSRWNSSIQDSYHIEHPYVATQPTMMHIYNSAAFGPDDFSNTMDYVSHPVIYAPSPYMQTWNSQLQYSVPVVYNSPCTNYTFSHHNQSNNFNSSVLDQQHKHNPYMQMNSYARDTYHDTNTCSVQARNSVDNVPMKSNYYYKKHQDNCRAVCDVPQYVAPVSYSKSQQGMNFMPATAINQCNTSYCPNQKYYKQNMTNYMKNPKGQIQDFICDDNASEDTPPIISPKEFVTSNVNLSNQSDQFATRVFKPEFKMRSNSGYRPPPSLPRYNGGFRRNTTFQDFPKEYTYPVSIGRGTYKTKKT